MRGQALKPMIKQPPWRPGPLDNIDTPCKTNRRKTMGLPDDGLTGMERVDRALQKLGSPLSEDAHQMMNRQRSDWLDEQTATGGASTVTEYCGRCGKPKLYIGDYWGQDPPPWCTCPPIQQWSSGQFKKQGWECPKCNRVYSPSVDECANCRPSGDYNITATRLRDGAVLTGTVVEDDESN